MSGIDEKETHRKRPEQYELKNAYDEMVRDAVQEAMDSADMCKCERCFLDVCAIVFNQGYTHFVNTKEGELLKKVPSMQHGNEVELKVKVLNAIKLVSSFPHHDKDEIV